MGRRKDRFAVMEHYNGFLIDAFDGTGSNTSFSFEVYLGGKLVGNGHECMSTLDARTKAKRFCDYYVR